VLKVKRSKPVAPLQYRTCREECLKIPSQLWQAGGKPFCLTILPPTYMLVGFAVPSADQS